MAFLVVPCDLGFGGQHEVEVPSLKGACLREEADAVARLGGVSCSGMIDLIRSANSAGGKLCTAWCANCNRTVVAALPFPRWRGASPPRDAAGDLYTPPCPLCNRSSVLRGMQVLT